MGAYKLSRKAFADIQDIYAYTFEQHNLTQAKKYVNSLYACFKHIAEHPWLGRRADRIASGLRRYECQSHVVFYVLDDGGVRIARVLHERMDASRRSFQ